MHNSMGVSRCTFPAFAAVHTSLCSVPVRHVLEEGQTCCMTQALHRLGRSITSIQAWEWLARFAGNRPPMPYSFSAPHSSLSCPLICILHSKAFPINLTPPASLRPPTPTYRPPHTPYSQAQLSLSFQPSYATLLLSQNCCFSLNCCHNLALYHFTSDCFLEDCFHFTKQVKKILFLLPFLQKKTQKKPIHIRANGAAVGVSVEVLEGAAAASGKASSTQSVHRSPVCLIVKNLPYSTSEEDLVELFGGSGPLARLVLPPTRTLALVEYTEPQDARRSASPLTLHTLLDQWRDH